ncbi:MAG: SIR2 family protein, partial [Caldilineaceae bacterium]|nr:SIR2 family protein [Caldilineaceae bacterium]
IDDEDDHDDAGEVHGSHITETLASLWAEDVGYPLSDCYDMARVAQFHSVKHGNYKAKLDYLDFNKKFILDIAHKLADLQEDDETLVFVEELTKQRDLKSFADIVTELDFPRFPPNKPDPLRILAKLPLSIYLTTSYYDFMERALLLEGRTPRTRLCLWNLEPANIEEQHRFDPSYTPDPKNPVVYHLHGLANYPSSMVLSEDDYLAFLSRLARGTPDGSGDHGIPPFLEAELRESSLLLMGYRLQDWDFRVLFRGLLNTNANLIRSRRPSVAIQFDPKDQPGISSEKEARDYLDDYFEIANFRVQWGSSDDFVETLWQKWQRWNNGGES